MKTRYDRSTGLLAETGVVVESWSRDAHGEVLATRGGTGIGPGAML